MGDDGADGEESPRTLCSSCSRIIRQSRNHTAYRSWRKTGGSLLHKIRTWGQSAQEWDSIHHENIHDLYAAASAGCPICKSVLAEWTGNGEVDLRDAVVQTDDRSSRSWKKQIRSSIRIELESDQIPISFHLPFNGQLHSLVATHSNKFICVVYILPTFSMVIAGKRVKYLFS